jgi:tetratricopeptide (TPR) repeat protein
MNDLEEAIDKARQAAQLTPPSHLNLVVYLNGVGYWLGRRFKRRGEMNDLEEAIDKSRQAVQSTPLGNPSLAVYSNNLAISLWRRFERSGAMIDLEEAIDIVRQSVQLTPSDYPSLAIYLNNLGLWLGARLQRNGEFKDLEESSRCHLGAFNCLLAAPLERAKAAACCPNKFARLGRIREGIELGRKVLDLLPRVHTRALDRSDQQFVVSEFAGIASDLCSFLLLQGQVLEAVECLEQGRTVIIRRLLDDRSDVSELAQKHPGLAQRYQSLVAEVNTPFDDSEDKSTTTARVVRRREAVTELEICLREIRATPNHDRFLLGQTVAHMQESIREGCIVMVNVSTIGSHAVVMTQDTLQVISIPGLNVKDAMRWLHTEWRSKKNPSYRIRTKSSWGI